MTYSARLRELLDNFGSGNFDPLPSYHQAGMLGDFALMAIHNDYSLLQ